MTVAVYGVDLYERSLESDSAVTPKNDHSEIDYLDESSIAGMLER